MEQRHHDFRHIKFYGHGWNFEYVHQSSSETKSEDRKISGVQLCLKCIKWIFSFLSFLSKIPIPILGM